MTSGSLALRGSGVDLGAARPLGALALAALTGALVAGGGALAVATVVALVFVPLAALNLPLALIAWIPLVHLDLLSAAGDLTLLAILACWLILLPGNWTAIRRALRAHPVPPAALAVLLGWVTLSVTWADQPALAWDGLWTWYSAALVLALVATTIRRPAQLELAAAAVVVGTLMSIAAGLLLGDGRPGAGVAAIAEGRFGGASGDPNTLAAGLVPAGALTIALAAAGSRRRRVVCAAALLCMLAALGATGSRGGVLAAAAAAIAAVALSRGARLRLAVIAVTGLVAGLAWILAIAPGSADRLLAIDASGTGRADLWTVATRVGADNPVLGVGINNYRQAAPRYVLEPGRLESVELVAERPHEAHSIYLQQFAETGVPGALTMLALFAGVLAVGARSIRRFETAGDRRTALLATGVVAGLTGALAASLFISNAYDKRLWILLGIAFALGALRPRERDA